MNGSGFKIASVLVLILFAGMISCKHQPLVPLIDEHQPESSPECDSDTVYFMNEIFPLLQSSCAMSNCHDATTQEDGVNLTSYSAILNTADVNPFHADNSELYEVLIESDDEDRMPPSPANRMSPDNINLIRKWINQGARYNECVESCDTLNVTYEKQVVHVLNSHCVGCHSGTQAQAGIDLSKRQQVESLAQSGRLVGALRSQDGYKLMPPGQALPECKIRTIEIWINESLK